MEDVVDERIVDGRIWSMRGRKLCFGLPLWKFHPIEAGLSPLSPRGGIYIVLQQGHLICIFVSTFHPQNV